MTSTVTRPGGTRPRAAIAARTLRTDRWWFFPLSIAAILGFFLGVLGVDRFYLGNIGLGVAKLLLGWLTAGIWPLIDWIIILVGSAHDGQGLPVKNWG